MTVTVGDRAAHRETRLLEMLSLTRWRRLTAETVALLALITVAHRWFGGLNAMPGMPHPYWIAILLVACQYGMSGGVIATLAACGIYWLEQSPPSAAEEFYAYAASVAIQPALWLATVLVVGGLRNLHINQSTETTELLAASEQRANDLSVAVERAVAEIGALERRIATDMSSVAALSRGLSRLDLSDRRAAAESYGEVLRAGLGAQDFTVYLKEPDGYIPVYAVQDYAPRPAPAMEPRPWAAIDGLIVASRGCGAAAKTGSGCADVFCQAVRVRAADDGTEPMAALVCHIAESQDVGAIRRRVEELSRAFATILAACRQGQAPEVGR